MSARKLIAASATALALAAMSVPVVHAQDGAPGSGLLPLDGLSGGSLEGGSLSGLSADGPEGDGGAGDVPEATDSGSAGSLDGLAPRGEEICELPRLGGSVAKFYPLFGIDGIPTGVIDVVTTALDSFPNLLELVAGEGAGAALLAETGSLNEGLCTSIFGGDMVMPPETVYVDPEGNPVTTVTSTVEPWAGSSGSDGADETSDASPSAQAPEASTSVEIAADTRDGVSGAAPARPTTVPVPGR